MISPGTGSDRVIRVLTVTSLYPNRVMPTFGVFVENRIRKLAASGAVDIHVVAPAPWFPFRSERFGDYGSWARVPVKEERHGISIVHPRYLALPKIGMSSAPLAMFASLRRTVQRLQKAGLQFDIIDAHYFYPDGVAAVMLGRALGKPVVVTARGTDLNLIPQYLLPRRMITWAASEAAGLITVCQALKDVLLDMGVADDRVRVLRNGVDLDTFSPGDREAARRQLGLRRPTLLSVGHLIPRKGHDVVVEAMRDLPDIDLLVAGEGPERRTLERIIAAHRLQDRVRLLGAVPHERLSEVYTAADALVLASDREGWPNVLLEAMACGTPVIASAIWGTPEVVAAPEAGVLMKERTAAGVVEGARRLFAAPPDRAATRRYAEGFSWNETTSGQIDLFRSILGERAYTSSYTL